MPIDPSAIGGGTAPGSPEWYAAVDKQISGIQNVLPRLDQTSSSYQYATANLADLQAVRAQVASTPPGSPRPPVDVDNGSADTETEDPATAYVDPNGNATLTEEQQFVKKQFLDAQPLDVPTGTTSSFTLTDSTTKLAEASNRTFDQFGLDTTSAFSTLGANLPGFSSMKSAIMTGNSGSTAGGMAGLLTPKAQSTIVGNTGTAQPSASAIIRAAGAKGRSSAHVFTLTERDDLKNVVIFEIMPQVTESHVVKYTPVSPAQFPGAFQKYEGTESVQWTVSATFVSRTSSEATKNRGYLNMLRGWTMPYFGQEILATDNPDRLGAPPPVLSLFGLRGVVGEVPVVITSLNWDWPKDVDYIPTTDTNEYDGNYVPWPVVLQVNMTLVESFSVEEFNGFDLTAYRNGDMLGAYSPFGTPSRDITADTDKSPTQTETNVQAPAEMDSDFGTPADPSESQDAVSTDSKGRSLNAQGHVVNSRGS